MADTLHAARLQANNAATRERKAFVVCTWNADFEPKEYCVMPQSWAHDLDIDILEVCLP
jgi:hypothetical protein